MADIPPAPQSPLKFGEPEKPGWVKLALMWTFIALSVIGIIFMIVDSKPEPKLVCRNAPTSLTGFGNCTAE